MGAWHSQCWCFKCSMMIESSLLFTGPMSTAAGAGAGAFGQHPPSPEGFRRFGLTPSSGDAASSRGARILFGAQARDRSGSGPGSGSCPSALRGLRKTLLPSDFGFTFFMAWCLFGNLSKLRTSLLSSLPWTSFASDWRLRAVSVMPDATRWS